MYNASRIVLPTLQRTLSLAGLSWEVEAEHQVVHLGEEEQAREVEVHPIASVGSSGPVLWLVDTVEAARLSNDITDITDKMT